MPRNTTLDPAKLTLTADTMELRVGERFPGSGLSSVAQDLAQMARGATTLAAEQSRPMVGIRLLGALVLIAIAAAAVYAAVALRVPMQVSSAAELVQGFEALVNIVVFGGIAIAFVFSVERRIKRGRALTLIASLRSVAHVIDMHQLTKDPDRLNDPLPRTAHSPPMLALTPHQLTRYLDHCSELLAILSKLAALQVQHFDDPVTLESVTDLENLTSGFSRKIWQKIMIIDRNQPPTPSTDKTPS